MGRLKAEERERRADLLARGLYVCSQCGEVKPIDAFDKASPSSGSFGGIKPGCRACNLVYATRHRERHPDKVREASRLCERRRWAEFRDVLSAACNARKKKERQDRPDVVRARDRAYRATRRVEHAASNRRRRYAKMRGGLTGAQAREVFSFYGDRCLCCGATGRLAIDHVIPLSWGGPHEAHNIQPLCVPCNSSKGARRSTDYRPDKGARFGAIR